MAEVLDISFEEYKKLNAINRGVLIEGTRSMAHVKAAMRNEDEGSAATKIGLAAHTMLLEPEKFSAEWGVKTLPWTTTAGRAQKKEMEEKYGDKILSEAEYAQVCQMMTQATTYDECADVIKKFIDGALIEKTILFEKHGVRCKARLDAINLQHGAVVDYKTTEDASEYGFSKSIGAWKYHIQAAFYLMAAQAAGFEIRHYVLIAQEKKSPYLCAVYRLDPESIERGERTVNYLLSRVAECQESNRWEGYGSNIKSISAPQWA